MWDTLMLPCKETRMWNCRDSQLWPLKQCTWHLKQCTFGFPKGHICSSQYLDLHVFYFARQHVSMLIHTIKLPHRQGTFISTHSYSKISPLAGPRHDHAHTYIKTNPFAGLRHVSMLIHTDKNAQTGKVLSHMHNHVVTDMVYSQSAWIKLCDKLYWGQVLSVDWPLLYVLFFKFF